MKIITDMKINKSITLNSENIYIFYNNLLKLKKRFKFNASKVELSLKLTLYDLKEISTLKILFVRQISPKKNNFLQALSINI